MRLHKDSMLHVYQDETKNPFYDTSPNGLCWEAIRRARANGKTVMDAWMGRGCLVNLITAEDGKMSVNLL